MPRIDGAWYARGRVNVQSGPQPFFGDKYPKPSQIGAGVHIPQGGGHEFAGGAGPNPGLDYDAELIYRVWGSNRIPSSLTQLISRFAPLNLSTHVGITGTYGNNLMTSDVWSLQQGMRLGPRLGPAYPTKLDIANIVAGSRFPQSYNAP